MGSTVETTCRPVGARHDLKSWPVQFEAVLAGRKTHEVRVNDRDYRVGDCLVLAEYFPEHDGYSGRRILAEVTHITPGGAFGLPLDLCVMSIRPMIAEGP